MVLFIILHRENCITTQSKNTFRQCFGSGTGRIRNFFLAPDLELLFWIRIKHESASVYMHTVQCTVLYVQNSPKPYLQYTIL